MAFEPCAVGCEYANVLHGLQVVPDKALLRLAAQRPDLVLELGLRMSQGLKQQLGQLQAVQQVRQPKPYEWIDTWVVRAGLWLCTCCNAYSLHCVCTTAGRCSALHWLLLGSIPDCFAPVGWPMLMLPE